ncbi:MAG TPA: hypothetical protein VJR58_32170 [Vineibacter sp.]|nr:hypothetical protein [Vineibacter sp.]
MAKKTWTEKLSAPVRHQVKPAPLDIAGMKKGEIMLIPSPRIIDDFIRKIPRGTSMDVKTLRLKLARRYKAEVTCPITTGFHLRTVAEAAYEAHMQGAGLEEITPFWRVLDADTPTTQRLACGAPFVTRQRAREGLK